MSTTDYLINGVLVLLVLRQIRASRMTLRTLLLPIGIVAGVGYSYLAKGIPTSGHDLALVVVLGLAGAILGAACALATAVWRDADGHAWCRAGVVAAGVWVVGISCRVVFSLASTNGGGPAINRFSVAHHITSAQAWTAALVIMAMAEVLTRVLVLRYRAHTARRVSAGARVGLAA
jgi:hypothetical protein